jgi:hypothetical protein
VIRRYLSVLMLATAVAGCSADEASDPRDLLAASTAGLQAGHYSYSAVIGADRVDGVTHMPSRTLSQTWTDIRHPGVHEATVIVAGDHHFLRTRVDRTWRDAERKARAVDAPEQNASTSIRMVEENPGDTWQRTDLTRLTSDRRRAYLTSDHPDTTGATDLLAGVQTAAARGLTVTGTLDPTAIARRNTAFGIQAATQAKAPVPYTASLDDEGRLVQLVIDLPADSDPLRMGTRWTLTVADYGQAQAPPAPTDR